MKQNYLLVLVSCVVLYIVFLSWVPSDSPRVKEIEASDQPVQAEQPDQRLYTQSRQAVSPETEDEPASSLKSGTFSPAQESGDDISEGTGQTDKLTTKGPEFDHLWDPANGMPWILFGEDGREELRFPVPSRENFLEHHKFEYDGLAFTPQRQAWYEDLVGIGLFRNYLHTRDKLADFYAAKGKEIPSLEEALDMIKPFLERTIQNTEQLRQAVLSGDREGCDGIFEREQERIHNLILNLNTETET